MKPCGNNQEKPFCQELFETVVLLKHVECVTVYVPKYRVKIVWSVIFVSDAMRPDISITPFIIASATLLVTVFPWHHMKLSTKMEILLQQV